MSVVINYLGDHEGAKQVADTVIKNGGQAVSIHADVSTEDGIASLVETATAHFGGLDVWVNNAGMEIKEPTHQVSLEDWNKVIAINQTGVFRSAGCTELFSWNTIRQATLLISPRCMNKFRGQPSRVMRRPKVQSNFYPDDCDGIC